MTQATTTERSFARPPISTLLAGAPREEWLHVLNLTYPDYEWRIGIRHVGSPGFRSEYPDFEIVAEYRRVLAVRKHRCAVYARMRQP